MSGVPLSRIREIADGLFPFEAAESWDNCGIQIGDPDASVESAAFSVDATPHTVQFASDNGCQLLVTHHPLIMEPVRRVQADDFTGRTLLDAARLGVAVLSMHTNLDASAGGLNDDLVSRLGLIDVVTPLPARCARLGYLEAPMRVSGFAERVARALQIDQLRIIAEGDPEVRRIFCATGSGMGYFPDACRHGAGLILTGDVRYHAAREALEMGIPVIDAGHFGLEKGAGELLLKSFSKEFQRLGIEVGCILCDAEREPFATLS